MVDPGDAELLAHYDEHGTVTRVTVTRADPVIRVAVDLLVQVDPNWLTTGVITLDSDGDYVYRFARMQTPDVAIFERVEDQWPE